jgi:hypothetical protein
MVVTVAEAERLLSAKAGFDYCSKTYNLVPKTPELPALINFTVVSSFQRNAFGRRKKTRQ